MATRAHKQLQNAIIMSFSIEASQTVYVGKTCKFGTADTAVQDAGADSDLVFGVVLPHPAANATTGALSAATLAAYTAQPRIEVALMGSTIVPMRVGTGDTTRGKKQIVVSDGITDCPAAAATTSVQIVGIALQSGVAVDMVGVLLTASSRLKA